MMCTHKLMSLTYRPPNDVYLQINVFNLQTPKCRCTYKLMSLTYRLPNDVYLQINVFNLQTPKWRVLTN